MARTSNTFKQSNNSGGRNQWRERPVLEDIPDLPQRLQVYINEGVRVKDIPQEIESDLGAIVKLPTIKKIMQRFDIKTSRRSGVSYVEKGAAILQTMKEDPLGRWGCRTVKEKLALQGVHVERDFIMRFRRAQDVTATANRHPQTRKAHSHGLYCSGPNEEWGMDGHEKILLSMGIGVYGIIDKYSRMELILVAVPNARDDELPLAVYLRTVKKYGGMPITSTSDKGTELRKVISVIGTLRATYQPYIPESVVASHNALKSPDNITRERNWRPLWEKDLANVLYFYRAGQEAAGFHPNNDFHASLSRWLWACIVQTLLDKVMSENQKHRIRGQKKSLMPTDARRIDMFKHPERFGGRDQLIPIPQQDIDRLLAEYDQPHLFKFVPDDLENIFGDLYRAIGSPSLVASQGWGIFRDMVNTHLSRA
ncbi:citrate synthase I [Coprinopsis cinerea AmutBmut pab1-1]|nr:citrate synthase I [Coprinopsis cinerea AmutBmut pab1-1]